MSTRYECDRCGVDGLSGNDVARLEARMPMAVAPNDISGDLCKYCAADLVIWYRKMLSEAK